MPFTLIWNPKKFSEVTLKTDFEADILKLCLCKMLKTVSMSF